MTDPIAVLRRAAEAAAVDLEPDPVAAVRSRVARHRSARRVRIGAVAAALALVAGAAVALATAGGTDPEDMTTAEPTTDPTTADPAATDTATTDSGTTDPTTTDTAPTTGAEAVPWSALAPRRRPAVAVTSPPGGSPLVVVWGGTDPEGRPLDDGAVFDTGTRTWAPMAASPLAGRPDEGLPSLAVDVGAGVVVGRGRSAARWSATSRAWTAVSDAPGPLTDLTGSAGHVVSVGAGAVLDNETPAWLPMTDLPVALARPTAVLAGPEVVAVGGAEGGAVVALVVDPLARTGRAAPAPEGLLGDQALAAAWDGERVVVTGPDLRAAAFDPVTDTWEALPEVPARFYEHSPSMASVGGVSVVTAARTLAVLDARRETWTPFPSPAPGLGGSGPLSLAEGRDTIVALWVDGAGPDDADLVLFDPTTLAGRDRRRQVGGASVLMAGDEHVLGTSVTDDGAVQVILATGAGGLCQVVSGLGLPLGSEEQRAVREVLPVADPDGPGAELVWFHDQAGGRWEAEVDDTDLLVIDCRDPDAARRLATSVTLT